MTKMYQLMIGRTQVNDLYFGKTQINDLYYDRDDAIENAKQLTLNTGIPVSIWEAEEIEGVSVDVLDWTTLATVRLE